MNSLKSWLSGLVTYGAFRFEVAQRGTGEVTVSSTCQPSRLASVRIGSYRLQL